MPYKHKADHQAAVQRWYDENKERKFAYQRDWYERNRERHIAHVKERRVIRKRELCERLELAESGIRAIIAEVKKNRDHAAIAAEWLLENTDIAEIVMVYRVREANRHERNNNRNHRTNNRNGNPARAATPRSAPGTQAPPPGAI